MSWLNVFKYSAGSNGIVDNFCYAISRIAFSWNANSHQIAVFNNLLEETNDGRLALHYTYNRLIDEECKARQNNHPIQQVSEEKIWGTPNPDKVDVYKQEVVEEQRRWERRGLTNEEINKRRVKTNNEPSREELLNEPIIYKQSLYFDEFKVQIHDKLNGRYTLEICGPYWNQWERPLLRWSHIGNYKFLQQDLYDEALYNRIKQMHDKYIKEQLVKEEHRKNEEKWREQNAPYLKNLEDYKQVKYINDIVNMQSETDSKPKRKITSMREQNAKVNHVRAAMGQNTSIDNNLLDESIF